MAVSVPLFTCLQDRGFTTPRSGLVKTSFRCKVAGGGLTPFAPHLESQDLFSFC